METAAWAVSELAQWAMIGLLMYGLRNRARSIEALRNGLLFPEKP